MNTPGPWNAYEVPTSINVRSKSGIVCKMSIKPNSGMADAGRADARLIAAAPELVNGCNALLGLLQLIASRPDISPEVREALTVSHRIDEARAALSKATTP